MTETLAYGYSSESTQRELSNEYQFDRVLRPCALNESSPSIGRVKCTLEEWADWENAMFEQDLFQHC